MKEEIKGQNKDDNKPEEKKPKPEETRPLFFAPPMYKGIKIFPGDIVEGG